MMLKFTYPDKTPGEPAEYSYTVDLIDNVRRYRDSSSLPDVIPAGVAHMMIGPDMPDNSIHMCVLAWLGDDDYPTWMWSRLHREEIDVYVMNDKGDTIQHGL